MSDNRIINVVYETEDGKRKLYDWTIVDIQNELQKHGLPSSRTIIYKYFRKLESHSLIFQEISRKQRGSKGRLHLRNVFQVWALITFMYWVKKVYAHLDNDRQRLKAATDRLSREELPTSAFYQEFPDFDIPDHSQVNDFLKVA